MKLGFAKGT